MHPLTYKQQNLVVRHLHIARDVAGMYARRVPSMEYADLYGEACFGLVQAATLYSDRHATYESGFFYNYSRRAAGAWIRYMVALLARGAASERENIRFVPLSHCSDDDHEVFMSTFPRTQDVLWFRTVQDILTPQQQELLSLRAEGWGWRELAERYGVVHSAVQYRYTKILEALKAVSMERVEVQVSTENRCD